MVGASARRVRVPRAPVATGVAPAVNPNTAAVLRSAIVAAAVTGRGGRGRRPFRLQAATPITLDTFAEGARVPFRGVAPPNGLQRKGSERLPGGWVPVAVKAVAASLVALVPLAET